MGKYIPAGRESRRTLSDTLTEAENEHYLDCPNADLTPRLAATLLDGIFLFIIISSLNRLTNLLPSLFPNESVFASFAMVKSVKIALGIFAWYGSQVWTTANYGGSPAKLILGLRVIDAVTGANLSFFRAFSREFIGKYVITAATAGLSILLPITRRDRMGAQDIINSSVVKKVRPG